jgi:hypothetical protein
MKRYKKLSECRVALNPLVWVVIPLMYVLFFLLVFSTNEPSWVLTAAALVASFSGGLHAAATMPIWRVRVTTSENKTSSEFSPKV